MLVFRPLVTETTEVAMLPPTSASNRRERALAPEGVLQKREGWPHTASASERGDRTSSVSTPKAGALPKRTKNTRQQTILNILLSPENRETPHHSRAHARTRARAHVRACVTRAGDTPEGPPTALRLALPKLGGCWKSERSVGDLATRGSNGRGSRRSLGPARLEALPSACIDRRCETRK